MRSYTTALEIREKLAKANPTNIALQNDLATSHYAVGYSQRESGHATRRCGRTRRRLRSGRGWLTPTPPSPRSRTVWPRASTASASCRAIPGTRTMLCRLTSGRWRSTRVWPTPTPPSPYFRLGSQRCTATSASYRPTLGTRTTRCNHTHRALAILKKLADANPTVTLFQADLAVSHGAIGALQRTIGHRDEALRSLETALVIMEKLDGRRSTDLYNRACVLALISALAGPNEHGAEAGDRAIGALRLAIASGFRNQDQIARNTHLDARPIAPRLPAPDARPGLSVRPVRTLISGPTHSAPRPRWRRLR